jgi:hypothetical protein
MAEIERSILSWQCLDRRIGSQTELGSPGCCPGRAQRNGRGVVINWRSTTSDARIKLKYLYLSIADRQNIGAKTGNMGNSRNAAMGPGFYFQNTCDPSAGGSQGIHCSKKAQRDTVKLSQGIPQSKKPLFVAAKLSQGIHCSTSAFSKTIASHSAIEHVHPNMKRITFPTTLARILLGVRVRQLSPFLCYDKQRAFSGSPALLTPLGNPERRFSQAEL